MDGARYKRRRGGSAENVGTSAVTGTGVDGWCEASLAVEGTKEDVESRCLPTKGTSVCGSKGARSAIGDWRVGSAVVVGESSFGVCH